MRPRINLNRTLPTVHFVVVRYVEVLGKIQPGHPLCRKAMGTVQLDKALRDGWTIVNLHDSYIALVK